MISLGVYMGNVHGGNVLEGGGAQNANDHVFNVS